MRTIYHIDNHGNREPGGTGDLRQQVTLATGNHDNRLPGQHVTRDNRSPGKQVTMVTRTTGSPLTVGQHLVGLSDLLEPPLCLTLVVRVLVRVPF